jgi:CxxC motif-containing protein (DUF1111 family)
MNRITRCRSELFEWFNNPRTRPIGFGHRGKIAALSIGLMILAFATASLGQLPAHDPGVRGGPAGVGGPLQGLGQAYTSFFLAARARFQAVDAVSNGLGPRFNLNSCVGCHINPAVGGSSPAVNPEVAVATLAGATNQIPSFISLNGPIREARFISNPDGTPDGGVHNLFVITGRNDAGQCSIAQPDFATAVSTNNVIFRIPTPLFGAGLVESITDTNILANAANPNKAALGISGHANLSGNTGTITRFGWKAQNASMQIFAGEAYNVEIGVTNDEFPNKRDETPGCMLNSLPEDTTNLTPQAPNLSSGISSDIVNFAAFARMLAPPQPAASTASTIRGQQDFVTAGCNLCHTPTLNTGSTSEFSGKTNVAVNAFSDFLVHDMGSGLADNVSQGNANGTQFRTAPLWGVGKRIFFLHDGRTSDLMQAIQQHSSSGSEANGVISNFNALTSTQQQDLLNFLRSL